LRAEVVKDGGSCRVDDAFFIHHQRLSGYSLRSEPAADVVIWIPVPLLQRLTFGRRPDGRPRQK